MKKRVLFYLFISPALGSIAQQTIIYTQYTFNKAGANPAASGTEINQKYNYVCGVNRQWVGFPNPPQQNFVNFSMTFRPPRSYHYWQNVGVYIDNEESGVSGNSGVYASYTFHLLLRKTLTASFGVYAGVRTFLLSTGSLDRSDPVVQKSSQSVLMYPDIIPGFRLSNKKFFIDLAARQVSIFQLKDFKGHKIGNPPSGLNPTLYFSYGRIIPLSDFFLLMPSMALNAPILAAPVIDLNTMIYYDSRVGFGLALRNISFLSAIFQLRIFRNITAGLSYSHSLNAMQYAAPNSFEIMIGVTPVGMVTKASGRHSVAKCPALDF